MSQKIKTGRFDRRGVLRLAGAAVPFVLIASLRAEASKLSKTASRYQDTPKDGKDCAGCKFFRAPSSCTLVEGSISAKGWCSLWQPK